MEWLKQLDIAVFRTVHVDWHRDWLNPVFWLITSTGLGHIQVLGLLIVSRLAEYKAYVPPLLAAFLLTGATNLAMKQLLPRERPSWLVWASPRETAFYDSFPSGHSVTSFGIAITLLLLTRGTSHSRLGWTAVFWAALVGYSRLYQGVHWATDVLAGAAIGLFWACVIVLFKSKRASTAA